MGLGKAQLDAEGHPAAGQQDGVGQGDLGLPVAVERVAACPEHTRLTVARKVAVGPLADRGCGRDDGNHQGEEGETERMNRHTLPLFLNPLGRVVAAL